MPIIPYIGVVFPFIGSLSLDRSHFYFLMTLKETLTFYVAIKSNSTVFLRRNSYHAYIRLLPVWFREVFDGNANISSTIKSSSNVLYNWHATRCTAIFHRVRYIRYVGNRGSLSASGSMCEFAQSHHARVSHSGKTETYNSIDIDEAWNISV